jgi:hypothetical protein
VAEEPFRAGGGVRAQPVGHVHRQHDPAAGRPWDGQRADRGPQPLHVDAPGAQGAVQRPVTTSVLGGQRELHQGLYRPIHTQQRIGQLEQRVRAGGQRVIELQTEHGQTIERLDSRERVPDTYHSGLSVGVCLF